MNLDKKHLEFHLNNSPFGVIEWDHQFNLINITNKVTELTGFNQEDLAGKNAYDLAMKIVNPYDLKTLLNQIDDLTKGRVDQNQQEFRIKTQTDHYLYTRWYNSALRDENGQLLSIFSIFEDLTEKKSTEKELSQKAQIIDSSADIISEVNPEGRFIRVNPTGVRMLGYDNEEQIITQHLTNILSAGDTHRFHNHIFPKIKLSGEWKGHLTLLNKNGGEIPVLATIQSHIDEKDNIESYSAICRDISNEIESSRKIKEKDQQLALAMEAGEMGTWIYYPQTNTFEVHDSWLARARGYNPDDSKNPAEWINIIHPEDYAEAEKAMADLLNGTKSVFEVEMRVKTHGNSWKWILNRAKITEYDENGRPHKISGIQVNIDDRKQILKDLERQEEHFRLLAENSTDAISRHLPDGSYIYVSPSIKDLTGYDPEDLIGTNPFDYMHPDDRETTLQNHKNLLNSYGVITTRFRKRTKNGDYKWVESTLRTIRCDQSGEVNEIQSSTRDISERVSIEQQLENEKLFIKNVIESLPGIFYMLDDQGKYVMWNKNFESVFGYSSEEILQKNPLDFYSKEDHGMITEKIKEAGETGDAEVEADVYDKNGKPHRYYLTGKGIIRNGQKYVIGTGIDISERLSYEHKLEQALKDKDVLIQEIHHRVKNNLAIISSFLQLQSFSSNSPEVQRPLLEGHQRILTIALIHEKLYKSRSFNEINLQSYFEDLLQTIKKSMDPDQHVSIDLRMVDLQLNLIQAVPCALILNELISNAFKHAFHKISSPRISVTGYVSNDYITLKVEDNGTGLPEDFNPKNPGTLGFQIVQKLCEQLEANLEITGQNGTCVQMNFCCKSKASHSLSFLNQVDPSAISSYPDQR